MKTEDIYFATLSMMIDKECRLCVKTSPYNRILVRKKGDYPNEVYHDMNTGKTYKASKEGLNTGDVFIDTLAPFDYITGNENKNLSKQKILKIYNDIVGNYDFSYSIH